MSHPGKSVVLKGPPELILCVDSQPFPTLDINYQKEYVHEKRAIGRKESFLNGHYNFLVILWMDEKRK
jgi:hypothetical protein